jgi:predicted Zn-dependent protease
VLRTQSYIFQHNGNLYHFIGVSTATDFPNYQQLFTQSMQEFRTVTDASILNKKADRIRIKTVSSSMTLAQFLRSQNVPDAQLEQYAILNGMALTDQLPAGTLVKVIGQ